MPEKKPRIHLETDLIPAPLLDHRAGIERIIFFSDAVIAIAITLLAIEIRLPESVSAQTLGPALIEMWPAYLSFLISFFVIGAYWIVHRMIFAVIRRDSGGLLALNLLFLIGVALIPFPTSVVARFGGTPLAEAFYGGMVALTGFAEFAVWRYAIRHELVSEELTAPVARQISLRILPLPGMFAISVPLAFVHPIAPAIAWCATAPVYFILRHLTVTVASPKEDR